MPARTRERERDMAGYRVRRRGPARHGSESEKPVESDADESVMDDGDVEDSASDGSESEQSIDGSDARRKISKAVGLNDTRTLGERLEATRNASHAAARRSQPSVTRDANKSDGESVSAPKRKRKDCPREISSRKPVPFGRTRCLGIAEQGGPRSLRPMDPRFEDHCGTVDEEHVERNFSFLNNMRERERRQVKQKLTKDPGNESLRASLRSMEAEEARRKTRTRRREIVKELKEEEKEKVRQGKKPYFFKESDVRERELQAKFQDLKAVGGVRRYIEKRRKRQASKDKRLLPSRR